MVGRRVPPRTRRRTGSPGCLRPGARSLSCPPEWPSSPPRRAQSALPWSRSLHGRFLLRWNGRPGRRLGRRLGRLPGRLGRRPGRLLGRLGRLLGRLGRRPGLPGRPGRLGRLLGRLGRRPGLPGRPGRLGRLGRRPGRREPASPARPAPLCSSWWPLSRRWALGPARRRAWLKRPASRTRRRRRHPRACPSGSCPHADARRALCCRSLRRCSSDGLPRLRSGPSVRRARCGKAARPVEPPVGLRRKAVARCSAAARGQP